MKYCQHCGAEIEDEAVVCIHCGCATNDVKTKTSNSNLGKIALIFMIIACVLNPILGGTRYLFAKDIETGLGQLIGGLITLAWCIPMTVHFSNKLKNGESVGIAFKICTLLFVSRVGGILMLCMPQENNK